MSDVKLTFIDRIGLILCKRGQSICMINMFTKKIVYQKEYPEEILDVNYIKDFHSIVVLTSKRILMYKIVSKDYSFVEFYALDIQDDVSSSYTSGRTFVENNVILASLNQTQKTEPYSACYVFEILGPKIKHSRFLVLSALRYMPIIEPNENKVTLFGILPWLGFSRRKSFTYFMKEGFLKEEEGWEGCDDQKEMIYVDGFRTIMQNKLENGGRKIIYGTREINHRSV